MVKGAGTPQYVVVYGWLRELRSRMRHERGT